jgi:hypothetical protein
MFNLSQLLFGLTFGTEPVSMRSIHTRKSHNGARLPLSMTADEQQTRLTKYKWMIGMYRILTTYTQ